MELITQAEFARRKGVSKQAVQKSIGRRIQEDAKTKLIDWDTQCDAWETNASPRHLINRITHAPQKAQAKPAQAKPAPVQQSKPVAPRRIVRAGSLAQALAQQGAQAKAQTLRPDQMVPPDTGDADALAKKQAVKKNLETSVAARTAKEVYAAKNEQLKYERDSGRLVDIDEVKASEIKRIIAAKNKILGIPAACKSRYADLPLAVVAVIEQVCRETLEDLANGRD